MSSNRHIAACLPTVAAARALCALTMASAMLACSPPKTCEPGLCPSGMRCAVDSGLCVDDGAGPSDAQPVVAGGFALVGLPGLRHAIAAYVPSRKSLVWMERGDGSATINYVVGEGVGDGLAAGEVVDAAIAPDGRPHLVWLRRSDATLWHGVRGEGAWSKAQIEAIAPRRPGDRLAMTIWGGQPAIAFDDTVTGKAVASWRDAKGVWRVEDVPMPPPLAGKPARVGGTIAISGIGGALSVAFYDPVGGDVIVSTRGETWATTRLAGRSADGLTDQGDVGSPVALTRDVTGGLAVLFRDRTENRVMLARSSSGAILFRSVDDGSYVNAELGATRRHIVGTALSAVTLANGRLAVAWQDASRARIVLGVEAANGTIVTVDVPAGARPQLRPRVTARVDGSVLVAWLELEEQGGGRVATWIFSPGGGNP